MGACSRCGSWAEWPPNATANSSHFHRHPAARSPSLPLRPGPHDSRLFSPLVMMPTEVAIVGCEKNDTR